MDLKIWHAGRLKTQEQAWADQSPYEIYRDACRRLELATTGYAIALRRRWPMLSDAFTAMELAYEQLPADAREYEDQQAQSDANLLALGLY